MTLLRFGSIAAVALACASGASADTLNIGFEDYVLGTLTGANAGYSGPDGRLPGQADGLARWYSPGNAATFGEVAARASRTGANGLALIRNPPLGVLDGVINGVQSPRLLMPAGETSAPVSAPLSRFRYSYWFRTGPVAYSPAIEGYRFGAEAWSSDRTTWHRFIADSSGNLNLWSVGTINDPTLFFFPNNDTLIASNLTWGAWYRVETTISFVNGGDDNDIAVTRVYDAANTLVGTGVDPTWESGQRHAGFNGGLPVAPDSFAFQARASDGTAFQSFTGDVAFVDDISIESLPPVDTALTIVDSCDNDNTIEVRIDLTSSNQPVAGGQFFLAYDASKLAYVGGTPGPSFPIEILDTAAPGTIDYACGINFGALPINAPANFTTLTFTKLDDVCAAEALTLVNFRPRPSPLPPTRLTDQFGGPIPTTTSDLAPFTMDGTPPVITCPPNVVVNSDAGGCTATLSYSNDFSSAPTLSPTQAPGVWYTDRFAPAGFTSGPVPGGTGLVHSISAADADGLRGSFNGLFYNTQGRKYDIDMPPGFRLGIDLYVPGTWATDIRRADIWGTAVDAQNATSGFPIIGFTSFNAADPNPNAPSLPAQPRWRVWNPGAGAWVDLVTPVAFNAWHRLEIELTSTSWVYYLNNVPVATFPNGDSVRIANTIVQAFNFGQSYDVNWDNLTFGPQGPVATDNCDLTASYVRSDNPLLTLNDPFPTGVTTVTWTAIDCSGNTSSCAYTVTVSGSNVFNVSVQLAGTFVGTFDRCISFQFFNGCPNPAQTIDQVVSFVNGTGTATFNIPCGSYNCVTARDKRHTLRQTASLGIGMGSYAASFTGLDALRGGNLNDDIYVDILDFGGFAGQFGVNYGTANTTCATPYPHADISANATVGIEDFTFIQANFLAFNEPNCCGNFVMAAPNTPGGPVSDIGVAQLIAGGLWSSARGDLNRDGRLNTNDAAIFFTQGLNTCTADFDNNGSVSTQDLFTYLNAWFDGHPATDLDHDSTLSTTDLFTFLNLWFRGC